MTDEERTLAAGNATQLHTTQPTDEERAALALAVGKRVRPHVAWHIFEGRARWHARATVMSGGFYDLFGRDFAEALAWLWERCEELSFRRLHGRIRAMAKVSGSGEWVYGDYTTPEEAVARIVAAWPEDG